MCPKSFINLASDTGFENSLAALKSSWQGRCDAKAVWLAGTAILQHEKSGCLALHFLICKMEGWSMGMSLLNSLPTPSIYVSKETTSHSAHKGDKHLLLSNRDFQELASWEIFVEILISPFNK